MKASAYSRGFFHAFENGKLWEIIPDEGSIPFLGTKYYHHEKKNSSITNNY